MEYAQIFIDNVFRLHGLPEVIILDWDPRFTGKFWRALFDLLSTDLEFSIAFHPQTDGQSERMIQMLENFLDRMSRDTPKLGVNTWHWRSLQKIMLSMWLPGIVHSTSILVTAPLYHEFSCMVGCVEQN